MWGLAEEGTSANTGLPASFSSLTSPNLASVPSLADSPGSARWEKVRFAVQLTGAVGEGSWSWSAWRCAAPVGKRRSSPSDRPGSATQDVMRNSKTAK